MKWVKILFIFIPVSIICSFFRLPPLLAFLFPALSIVPLSFYISEATESISLRTGQKLGGFLNATFGNTVEIVISIFALRAGLVDLVISVLIVNRVS